VVSFNPEIPSVSAEDRPSEGAAEDHLAAGHWWRSLAATEERRLSSSWEARQEATMYGTGDIGRGIA
jgi:hypothetical protein